MTAYLDNSATTRCFDEVREYMSEIMDKYYGNPSSMHMVGVEAENHIRYATEVFSGLLKADPKEIVYTSGGTESDNLALIGCARANARAGRHIITTKIEHPAVLETCAYLEKEGYEVTYLDVDESGLVRADDLKAALRDDTILVSVMYVNNEIGSLQPIGELGHIIKEYNKNILFHVDAVQGFGKAVINPAKMKIDLMSASSHKIHGSKGCGLLYVGDGVRIVPIEFGGGQQKGLRSGTENVPGISGMALAAKMLYGNYDSDVSRLYELKKSFVERVMKIEGVSVNGLVSDGTDKITETAPHIISISVKDVRAEVLLHSLEGQGIYVSAGSACSTHKRTPSATLVSIGLDKALLESTIRLSMSVFTTRDEMEKTASALEEIVPQLRRFVRR